MTTRIKNEPSLLPAIEFATRPSISQDIPQAQTAHESQLSPPSDIQRPRSALHTGDFTAHSRSSGQDGHDLDASHGALKDSATDLLGTSSAVSWFAPALSPFQNDPRFPPAHESLTASDEGVARSRPPSLQSYSSSYILKHPTSPLVQQSNNNDLDFSPIELSENPDKSYRRRTLPPHDLLSWKSSPDVPLLTQSESTNKRLTFRRENTLPHQTHRSRRSLTSNWSLQASTSPQIPAPFRSRRPSFSSEASPLHHASMVGSYEESILHGRMSTGPSRPLDFTAQIGALGKGNCKPKYPAHVTVPFPAVFYSWSAGVGRTTSSIDDEPSPYVGHIDLEYLSSLNPLEGRRRELEKLTVSHDLDTSDDADSNREQDPIKSDIAIRRSQKRKRRSASPKAPVGGGYRIPRSGHLQIVIKNPNKTAVKLFLVPYDLEGMEPGTKTFIRQRCFSAGPVIEDPLTSGEISVPTPNSKAAPLNTKAKPSLRYLIHLNICCPTKGRYYLYHHIRVVFANRVPDNKEKLQNEIQLPEPRYSVYKPTRESPMVVPSASVKLSADKARRRSYGFASGMGRDIYEAMDGLQGQSFTGGSTFSFTNGGDNPPVPPVPFHVATLDKESPLETAISRCEPIDVNASRPTSSGLQSPLSDKTRRIANTLSESFYSTSSHSSDSYTKLSRGDVGYGGVFGRPGTPEPGEGLLAKRLRELATESIKMKQEDQ